MTSDAQTEAIARFEITYDPDIGMIHRPHDHGYYVRYEDHATALAAKDAELALAVSEREFWREAAARDQAQLAEANKALERIIALDSSIDATPRGERKVIYGTFAAIARLAREAQGGE